MNCHGYQRLRLWAGITSIGANLAIIWALALSAGWWSEGIIKFGTQLAVLAGLAVAITLVNLPFDLLVGQVAERLLGRTEQTPGSWLKDWLVERLWITLSLSIGFGIFLLNFRIPALLPILVGVFVLMLAAYLLIPWGRDAYEESPEAVFEPWLKGELANLNISRELAWYDNAEESVNGYIHPGGELVLSASVAVKLTPREAALLCYREEWYRRSGTWMAGFIISAGWLLCGVVLAVLFPATTAIQAALGGAAIMSSWCFLALFVWPSLSSRWTAQADRSLLKVASQEEVAELLTKVQQLNATDTELPDGKTAIFHPIPPLEDRLETLQ